MRIGEFLQHEVAPCARAVGMLARVVVGGTLDQSDQQREFADVELVERLCEVVLAAKSDSVYCALAVLAEVDLVQIRDQYVLLGEARLEPKSHYSLGRLAGDGLLVG